MADPDACAASPPPPARPSTCASPPAAGVEHARRHRPRRGRACATARCPSATSRDVSLDTRCSARAARAAGRLGDDRRHGARRRRSTGRLAARRPSTASRWCSARAARCSTTPRCCATYRAAARGRRCCWPTSARRSSRPDGPARAARLVELLGADGLSHPPQPAPGGGAARGRARLRRRARAGSPPSSRGSRRCRSSSRRSASGMDGADVALLRDAGVAAVDVAGAGGTNWALIEGRRDPRRGRGGRARSPTGACRPPTRCARRVAAAPGAAGRSPRGGLRDGVEVAKCLALGARAAGLARPLLVAAQADRAGEARGDAWSSSCGSRRGRRARRRPPRSGPEHLRMRVVVVGAGLGGLARGAAAAGRRATTSSVLEQRERPGGRAYQLRDGGFTWDTGPSLMTMPWVLEETFAAGGLDLHSEVDAAPARPALPDPLGRARSEHLDFVADRDAAAGGDREASRRATPARLDGFLAALKPIYEDGILAAGRRAVPDAGDLARFVPRAASACGAALPLHRFVARYFEHPRVREAFSFHSLFIGGDPYRVPAIYGALVYLQFARRRLVRRRRRLLAGRGDGARRSTCAAARGSSASSTRGGRVTGVALRGGERIAADVVVSNADVLRTHELLGRAGAAAAAAPDDVVLPALPRHRPALRARCSTTRCSSARLPRLHPRRDARAGAAVDVLHLRPRARAHRAGDGGRGRRLALRPAAGARTCAAATSTGRARPTACATRSSPTSRRRSGSTGLGASVARRAPHDAGRLRARARRRVDGNAFAVEPTLHQSACVPPAQPRPPRARACTTSAAGRIPAPGIPGVLLGAEVTAGLVAADRRRRREEAHAAAAA